MQNVHFSITPRERTVTSGLSCQSSGFSHVDVEPVEPPDFVRAVVRAIARADAAVVDLRVEPFVVVDGGVDRADRLARRGVALLAEQRQESQPPGILVVAVRDDPQPGHLPAAADLLLADHGHVVLRVTGHRARAAADAPREVNHHRPAVLLVLVRRVDIASRVVSFRQRQDQLLALALAHRPHLGERRPLHDLAALLVLRRAGERRVRRAGRSSEAPQTLLRRRRSAGTHSRRGLSRSAPAPCAPVRKRWLRCSLPRPR